ncbi:DUF6809 family protein [Clostridium sp. HCS.1]|uniref:DUF6809 family protein n=1 Tax=Clostridium sp. HCS.1 TaxID=3238594 RepID=UPI003A0FC7D2
MKNNKVIINTIETMVKGETIIKVVEDILDNEINSIQMEQDDSSTALSDDIIKCYENLLSKLDEEGKKALSNLESLMIQERVISEKTYFEKGLKAGLSNLNFLKDLGAEYIL